MRRDSRASLGAMRRSNFNGDARTLFAPYQSHFSSQSEFPPCLTDTVFASTQNTAQQVGNLVMTHPAAIVANGNTKIAFGGSFAFLGTSSSTVTVSFSGAALGLKEFHVFGFCRDSPNFIELGLRQFLDFDMNGGQFLNSRIYV